MTLGGRKYISCYSFSLQAETARRLEAERESADKQHAALLAQLKAQEDQELAAHKERIEALHKQRAQAAKAAEQIQVRHQYCHREQLTILVSFLYLYRLSRKKLRRKLQLQERRFQSGLLRQVCDSSR